MLLHLVSNDGEDGVRFLGVKEDACIDKAVDHCNIEAGETVEYTNTMFISPLYPLVCLVHIETRQRLEQKDKQFTFLELIDHCLPKFESHQRT